MNVGHKYHISKTTIISPRPIWAYIVKAKCVMYISIKLSLKLQHHVDM